MAMARPNMLGHGDGKAKLGCIQGYVPLGILAAINRCQACAQQVALLLMTMICPTCLSGVMSNLTGHWRLITVIAASLVSEYSTYYPNMA